jgi:magnesium chelatase family protein
MLVKTYGSAVYGVDAHIITVETNIAGQGVNFFMVGLPDNAVKESQMRIHAALKNIGYNVPGKTITINMAPADLRKEGSAYDLTIAVGILAASEQMKSRNVSDYIIMGELSLDGGLQPMRGVLPIAIKAREAGFKGFILPKKNAREAAIVDDLDVYGVENIQEVIHFFDGKLELEKTIVNTREEFYRQLNSSDLERAGEHKARHGNCGSRWAQSSAHWAARGRKDHACQAPSNHSSATFT